MNKRREKERKGGREAGREGDKKQGLREYGGEEK